MSKMETSSTGVSPSVPPKSTRYFVRTRVMVWCSRATGGSPPPLTRLHTMRRTSRAHSSSQSMSLDATLPPKTYMIWFCSAAGTAHAAALAAAGGVGTPLLMFSASSKASGSPIHRSSSTLYMSSIAPIPSDRFPPMSHKHGPKSSGGTTLPPPSPSPSPSSSLDFSFSFGGEGASYSPPAVWTRRTLRTGGVYTAQKPSTASGVRPAQRNATNDCGGRHVPPPTISVHATLSMGLRSPKLCEST
mmetsp:Transcript_3949/g.8601  ORF Transcript_3949/g.8601 Transcript_3949/m.8601 type:complete len:245 (+) Transcript_3949:62-796(+)